MMYGAGGQKRLPEKFVADYEVPITDLSTQKAVARRLDERTAHIDALIEKQEQQIKLLREYRSALITAAINGDLDL